MNIQDEQLREILSSAKTIAADGGLAVVMDRCTMQEHRRLPG